MRLILACCFLIGCSNSHGGVMPEDAMVGARDAAAPPDAHRVAADDAGATLVGVDAGAIAVDAGAVGADSGATGVDAGVPIAVDGRIACGASACEVGRQGCLASCLYATDERMPACIELSADGTWPARDCPSGREMFPRYWLRCDGAEDCPSGQSCHMLYGSLGQYASCDTCTEPCDRRSFHELCHGDADCPSDAPSCLPSADLPGYSTCEPIS